MPAPGDSQLADEAALVALVMLDMPVDGRRPVQAGSSF